MNRFAVLFHEIPKGQQSWGATNSTRGSHWDLMLELDDALVTWALNSWPPIDGELVCRLPDHRLEYLHFEGPLTGNRGSVVRVDCGHYQTLEQTSALWHVRLNGEGFQGCLKLVDQSGKTECPDEIPEANAAQLDAKNIWTLRITDDQED